MRKVDIIMNINFEFEKDLRIKDILTNKLKETVIKYESNDIMYIHQYYHMRNSIESKVLNEKFVSNLVLKTYVNEAWVERMKSLIKMDILND